jgi:hypothetical protein
MDPKPAQEDPGWRPAVALAGRIALLRRPQGSILTVLRATVVFLAVAPGLIAVLVLLLGAGSRSPQIEQITAQIALFAAVGLAATAIALIGREHPDDESELRLAAWVFRTTMRRVLAAAAVGPVGLLLSWMAGDGAWVIYGAGASIVLISIAAPTASRLQAWQEDIGEEGLSVLQALQRRYG